MSTQTPNPFNLPHGIPDIQGKDEDSMHAWFLQMDAAGLLFHPEDDPAELFNDKTGKPTFTEEEARCVKAAIDRLVELHGWTKIIDFCFNAYQAREGWEEELEEKMRNRGDRPTA